jgi:putative ABC transport system permease protein
MVRNYLLTAIRNLLKNRTYSFLNIAGLALGITCAALIFLWVEDELNFDNNFSNKEFLYSVKDKQTYDGKTFTFDATPGLLANGIKSEIPGIKATARSTWGDRFLFIVGEKSIYEQGLQVDPDFLSMFSLEFIKGNPVTAFKQLYSIVITENMAMKFFQSTDVIGQSLKVNNNHEFIVTGVIKNLPQNSSLSFEFLTPFQIYLDDNTWLNQWGNNGVLTFVQLEPGADADAINKKLDGYIQSKDKELNARMSIYPMQRWRLYDNFDNGVEIAGRIKYVKLFSLIAWIIIIIACINFMNLATARSEQRAREVGVRKVLGAEKKNLISQFLGEAMFMCFIASLLSLIMIYCLLPVFNLLVEKKLAVNIFQPSHICSFIALTILCGLIAGSYPAFFLSSFTPVAVLKGSKIKTGSSTVFIRKGLVILQFSISVILIISTIIIYRQIRHVQERDLGYNKSALVNVAVRGKMKSQFNMLKNELLQLGSVQNVCMSNNSVLQLGSNTGDYSWTGKDPSKQVLITVENVSPEYISTMGMHLKDGRDFYSDMNADSSNVIINETLAKMISKKSAVGSILTRESGTQFTVVGVVNNFIYNNMYAPADPLILFSDTSQVSRLSIRFKPNTNYASELPKAEAIIKKSAPAYPIEFKFVDDQFKQFFKSETLIGKLAGIFATLAIVISCLGLFGLAAYTAEKRTKEIGIRKVLGASVSRITALLSKDFLKLVFISFCIAFPLGWYFMNSWLQDFEYRITISWSVFLFAGMMAVFIAFATISFQAVKAALTNPIKNLRTE